MSIVIKVDLRTIVMPPVRPEGETAGYLADLAGEFGGRELIATTDDEGATEFVFEGDAEKNAANAAGFRRALRSFIRSSDPRASDSEPESSNEIDPQI